MKNQLILNAPKLPWSDKWKVHNYYTPDGVKKMKHLKFEDFSRAEWHGRTDGFDLFKLILEGNSIMAFCRIVKK